MRRLTRKSRRSGQCRESGARNESGTCLADGSVATIGDTRRPRSGPKSAMSRFTLMETDSENKPEKPSEREVFNRVFGLVVCQ
jgi:hypothetical protein